MICHFDPITEEEYLYNWLQMLSCVSIEKLAVRLGVVHEQVMLHPDFKAEADKMINEITF